MKSLTQFSDTALHNQALGLLLREKCRRFTAVFALLVAIAALNCWWFRSLFVDPPQYDLVSNNNTEQPSNNASPPEGETCDLSKGRWVPNTKPPMYTNETCKYIHPSQDCMKNGRPDKGYLNWRWQPLGCELLDFDAHVFLELMRGKKMVFIGDSISRNHMQSLLCTLSQLEEPQNVYFDVKEKDATWKFASFNFTLANIWSPFLVNHTFEKNIYHIHLDMPDIMWSKPLPEYDVAIVSTGYWYFRPSIYYLKNKMLGTNPHSGLNFTTFDKLPAMKIAWGTILNHMIVNFKGITILRTITVPHFESGTWSSGGACNKTQPYFDPLMKEPLPWMSQAITLLQIEEYTRAMEHIKSIKFNNKEPKLKLLNITYSSFLRPDGHPSSYRIQTAYEPRNDCLHWCLPGPIDMWNQLLFHILLY